MSLFACEVLIKVSIDQEHFSDVSRGRERFICVWLLYLTIREYWHGGVWYRSNPPSWREFFLCAFSRSDEPGRNSSLRSELQTLACWCRDKREEKCEAKQLSKYSLPAEALNSLPVEVNNSTGNLIMSHICPLRGRKAQNHMDIKMCIVLWSLPRAHHSGHSTVKLFDCRVGKRLLRRLHSGPIVFKPLSQKKTSREPH